MAPNKAKLLDIVEKKAKNYGPVRTFLLALHLGNHNETPLSTFTKNLEAIEDILENIFTKDEMKLFFAVTASAFRYFKEFTAASHFFHKAEYIEDYEIVCNLAWEFGNLEAISRIDKRQKKENKPLWLPNKESRLKFIIEKVVPTISLKGDQYHGFRFNKNQIDKLRKELASTIDFKQITKDTACYLLKENCQDIARLYILAIHSEDSELINQVGADFTKEATLPRRRTIEIIQTHYPDSKVEILKEGDTLSVRPEHRFIIKLTHKETLQSCILKELLSPVLNCPLNKNHLLEYEILSKLEINGIPSCHEIVKLKGLSFIKICHLKGKSLAQLRTEENLPTQDELLEIIKSLISIMVELHEQNIAHLDICEKNILVDRDNTAQPEAIKTSLVGFDNACKLGSESETWVLPKPPIQNMSPECVTRFKAGKASDCFQLGLLIHRLLTEKHVFGWPEISAIPDQLNNLKQLDFIIPMLYREPNIDQEKLPEKTVEIISGLLIKNPESRMTAKTALLRFRGEI